MKNLNSRKIIAVLCLLPLAFAANAQNETEKTDEPDTRFFKKERVFVGASIGLGFSSGIFNVGANPEVGYSIANWLDAGISTNINYASSRADYYNNFIRQRSTTYGGGVFVRVFPLRGFFLQMLPEYNWRSSTYKQGTSPEFKYKEEAPSLLAGVGYGSRNIGTSGFFTTIMFDLGNNSSSPYINTAYDQNGNLYKSKLPIIRSGFNIYLGSGRKR